MYSKSVILLEVGPLLYLIIDIGVPKFLEHNRNSSLLNSNLGILDLNGNSKDLRHTCMEGTSKRKLKLCCGELRGFFPAKGAYNI